MLREFRYLKNYISSEGFIFLQETHSSTKDEQKWKDDFKYPMFCSHDKTNSCGVAIGYYGSSSFNFINKISDKKGGILILGVTVNDDNFLLINLYNSNTKSEQIVTLSALQNLLEKIDDIKNKNIILGGDFNLIFDSIIEASGGNPILKMKSIAKLIEIKETLNLCDTWRIRNPNCTYFTFRQNHTTGLIQRRLDYFFISNILQESVKTDALASFCSEHSPITFSIKCENEPVHGKGLWKFNNSVTNNIQY